MTIEKDELPEGKLKRETWNDVVREVFPDANGEVVDFLLWERTAFPHAGRDYILDQLKTLKATEDAGRTPCDDCNKPAVHLEKIFKYCDSCQQNYERMSREYQESLNQK